jgi:D-amino-acid dehydrogenase
LIADLDSATEDTAATTTRKQPKFVACATVIALCTGQSSEKFMRVIVLGAGVIGVTTACYVAKRGFQVTVVDRAACIASGASHANGGQLSYSFTDALARPGMPGKVHGLVRGADTGIRIRLSPDCGMLRWALRFAGQCTRRNFNRNTAAVLRLAMQSSSLMEKLVEDFDLDFALRTAGKLVLLRNDADIAAARNSIALKKKYGCDVSLLTLREASDIEPAIGQMRSKYAAAIFSAGDQVGDARLFSVGLAGLLEQRYGVRFCLSREATGLQMERGRVSGVRFADDTLDADAVIVCLGAWSNGFLGTLAARNPLLPVRGYSVTLPPGGHAPRVSITDVEHRIVFSSMNGLMRIAGFADFLGFDTSMDASRIESLLNIARSIAPEAADYEADTNQGWGGFRPMTADSQPIVGPARVPGLYLNTGHGMLGWTLACATGFNIAQMVAE